MIPDDVKLMACNDTELRAMARAQGLGHLRRGLDKDILIGLVTGSIPLSADYVSGVAETRIALQAFILEHWERARSQLPGCDGKCTTYPCTEGKHALCISGNEDLVRNQ
jgi:hypothetical protein